MPQTKGPKYDRVVGLDLGNGLINTRSATTEGEEYRTTFPSEFAYQQDIGDQMDVGKKDSKLDLDTYEIDGSFYVWGKDISKLRETQPTSGYDSRYKTEAYRIMVSIALGRAVKDLNITPQEKILVVTGVPSNETNTVSEDEITDAFLNGKGGNKGLYKLKINDDEYIFNISHVEVTAQALATVIGRYLDVDGSVKDESYENSKVGVIDIGAGTIDFDVLDQLRRLRGHDSIPRGFNDIYEKIKAVIRKQYPAHRVNNFNLFKVIQDAQKDRGGNTKEIKYIYTPSKTKDGVDFTEAFKEGILEIATDIQQAVTSHWKDQTGFDEILLVGGSAKEFKKSLSKSIGGITIPQNSGESNVEGYYRLGMEILTYGS